MSHARVPGAGGQGQRCGHPGTSTSQVGPCWSHQLPSILESIMSPQPNSLRSSHRPTQLLATCTTSVMSFATSTPRSGSTGGWVSLFRRHHFPRLPRVQENAAPSESGSTHVTFRHSFVELVTVADDRHGGPVGAETTLVPLQALPEILDPFTQTSCNCGSPRRHSRDSGACTFSSSVQPTLTPRWRGSRPLESLPAV